ncbi:MAG: hypothetical protein KDE27_16480, partial [Planctomycetes bacterium]|nr:hypothetical protein [Planctomycetota bacterium]
MPKSWPKSPVPFAWPAAAAVLAAACGVAPPPAPPAVGLLFRYCRELGDGLRSDLPASGAPIDRPGATATPGD